MGETRTIEIRPGYGVERSGVAHQLAGIGVGAHRPQAGQPWRGIGSERPLCDGANYRHTTTKGGDGRYGGLQARERIELELGRRPEQRRDLSAGHRLSVAVAPCGGGWSDVPVSVTQPVVCDSGRSSYHHELLRHTTMNSGRAVGQQRETSVCCPSRRGNGPSAGYQAEPERSRRTVIQRKLVRLSGLPLNGVDGRETMQQYRPMNGGGLLDSSGPGRISSLPRSARKDRH